VWVELVDAQDLLPLLHPLEEAPPPEDVALVLPPRRLLVLIPDTTNPTPTNHTPRELVSTGQRKSDIVRWGKGGVHDVVVPGEGLADLGDELGVGLPREAPITRLCVCTHYRHNDVIMIMTMMIIIITQTLSSHPSSPTSWMQRISGWKVARQVTNA
jgi:hypothetical protein